jgi:hypothetical protein
MERVTIGPMRKLKYEDGYATPEFVRASRSYLYFQLGSWRDMGYFVQLTTLPNGDGAIWMLTVQTYEQVYTSIKHDIRDAIQDILDVWVDVPHEENQNPRYQERKREFAVRELTCNQP